MEVHFPPEREDKLNDLPGRSGVPAPQLVEDVVAGYVEGLSGLREMLDGRYDDLKSGRVEPVDGEEFFEKLRLREKELLNDASS
jgi:hypothetical protein